MQLPISYTQQPFDPSMLQEHLLIRPWNPSAAPQPKFIERQLFLRNMNVQIKTSQH